MAGKNNTLLWVGGGGIALLLLYEYFKGTGTTTTAATNTMSDTVSTTSVSTPNLGVLSPDLATAAAGQQAAATQSAPAGIDVTTYTTVQKWGLSDGRAPILAMLAANIPSEYAGMYDIIVNSWDAGVAPTAAQTTFWNNLRSKYGW